MTKLTPILSTFVPLEAGGRRIHLGDQVFMRDHGLLVECTVRKLMAPWHPGNRTGFTAALVSKKGSKHCFRIVATRHLALTPFVQLGTACRSRFSDS